jgi:hypothetical protein
MALPRSGIIFIVQNSTPSFTYFSIKDLDEEIQLMQRHLFLNPNNLWSGSDVLIHVALKGKLRNLTGATSRTGTAPQGVKHKRDHELWRWKSRSWLGTGTNIWRIKTVIGILTIPSDHCKCSPKTFLYLLKCA